jgi:RimJ/RimL family protein N-acetyltransferase
VLATVVDLSGIAPHPAGRHRARMTDAADGTDWSGTTVLTTDRLLLRTWRPDDLPAFAGLNRDPAVMEFLGGQPLPRQESDAIAAYANELWATRRLGLLAVERRDDGALLGMCGLHVLHEWYPDDVELAFRLARPYWGHGYASEAAAAWLAYGFDVLGLERVISVTDRDPPNSRSIGVARRLGMVWDHDAELSEGGTTFAAVVHSITAGRWRAAQPGRPSPAT